MTTKDNGAFNDPLAEIMRDQIRNNLDLLANGCKISDVGALTVQHDIGELVTRVVCAALKHIRMTGGWVHRIHATWDIVSPHPVLTISVGSTHGEAMVSFTDSTDFCRLQKEARELRGKLVMKNTEVSLSLPLH